MHPFLVLTECCCAIVNLQAWDLYEGEQPLRILDPRLEKFDAEEALRVIRVALMCTQGSPHRRPPMSRVVAMLTGKPR